MGIKYIHMVLIIASIALSAGFGLWAFYHNSTVSGYCSFAVTACLILYFVQFIKKMKAL